MMRRKTILILESSESTGGHHPTYLKRIIEACHTLGANIVVSAPEQMLNHPQLASCVGHFTALKPPLLLSSRLRVKRYTFRTLVRQQFLAREVYKRAFEKARTESQVDLVIVPCVDDCLIAMTLIGSPFSEVPWLALSMRTRFHFAEMNVKAPRMRAAWVHRWFFMRFLRSTRLASLLSIDQSVSEWARRGETLELSKIRLLPDPSPDYVLPSRHEARAELSLPDSAKVILIYGALSERKGVKQLMQAMTVNTTQSDLHLLLAGTQDSGIRDLLNSDLAQVLCLQNRLHVLSGYVPDKQVATLLAASDAMWIGYISFYNMSSVFVLAGRHRVPCITSDSGLIGYLANRFNAALVVDPENIDSVCRALTTLAQDTEKVDRVKENATKLFEHYGENDFREVLSSAVLDALSD